MCQTSPENPQPCPGRTLEKESIPMWQAALLDDLPWPGAYALGTAVSLSEPLRSVNPSHRRTTDSGYEAILPEGFHHRR